MAEATREAPDGTETLMLLAGIGAVILGYVMPAITFKGTGNVVHDLSIIEKVPLLSVVAFAGLAAALATRFVPNLRKWAEHASVFAILLVLAPALWGFMMAIDVWSGLRPVLLQMAGIRTVRIDPGLAYLPLAAGAALIGFSLRVRVKRLRQEAMA